MTKYVKEIWIQFTDNETYSENEEKLFELLDKAQGECEVKVFNRVQSHISRWVDIALMMHGFPC